MSDTVETARVRVAWPYLTLAIKEARLQSVSASSAPTVTTRIRFDCVPTTTPGTVIVSAAVPTQALVTEASSTRTIPDEGGNVVEVVDVVAVVEVVSVVVVVAVVVGVSVVVVVYVVVG